MSQYELVCPAGRGAPRARSRAARPGPLDGLTIAGLFNHKLDSEFTFEAIGKALLQRDPGVRCVAHREFGDTYGVRGTEVLGGLADKLKALECDLVISANAG
jgi:hypothetical protein